MKITFVGLGWEQLSISILSALARKAGHEVSLVFNPSLFNDRYNLNISILAYLFNDEKYILKEIEKQDPDVLAFSPVTGTYQWMLGIAEKSKLILPKVKTVFGGVHVSAVPDKVLSNPQVDFICVGEGDIAFLHILEVIRSGNYQKAINNTRYKKENGKILSGSQAGFIQDLDSLPIFDKTIWEDYMNLDGIYFTMASRGCPYKCSYCFNSYFSKISEGQPGKYIRYRSVGHLMNEMRFANKRYNIKFVEFEDDVFTFNKKWLKEFLYVYKKEIDIPFQCLSHPAYMDEEVSKLLKDAGCVYVQMGIQSMDDKYKKEFLRRYETSEDVDKAMTAMRKHGLKVKVDHMFGLPDEPISAQKKAEDLYKKYSPYRIQTFWTNFLPGTELIGKALDKGQINTEDVNNIEEGEGIDFYRNSSMVNTSDKVKQYKAYEAMFKIMSLLPHSKQQHVKVEMFKVFPVWFCSLISFICDVAGGILKKNPDHIAYAKFYMFNIYNRLLRLFGQKPRKATIIKDKFDVNEFAVYLGKDDCILEEECVGHE